MHVITARNVHAALPLGIRLLYGKGVDRASRNGPVKQFPMPVTTVYERPQERVLFWPERDANPFFHLYESLWMLAGRDDVAGVVKYAKNMASFSDDGKSFHGAYGWRWRTHFSQVTWKRPQNDRGDQLTAIAEMLKKNHDDRRAVLAMWDANSDLGREGKDFPCNLTATFQVTPEGNLDLTVFCRSNDIIWGAYGANAVHFSMLLEYMAFWIGVPVGVYRQVSVNWHAYIATLESVKMMATDHWLVGSGRSVNPYVERDIRFTPMEWAGSLDVLDFEIRWILEHADAEDLLTAPLPSNFSPWGHNVRVVLKAHEAFRRKDNPHRHLHAYTILKEGDQHNDFNVAANEWLQRRYTKDAGRELAAEVGSRTQADFYPGSRYGSKYERD